MEKDLVIKLKNILRGDQNYPLRVFIADNVTVVDETSITQVTKWDDENGIIYSFRLPGPTITDIPNNAPKAISITAISYENIQGIEVIRVPVSNLDAIFDKIDAISSTEGETIKKLYNFLLSNDLTNINPSTIAAAMGASAKDDYYNGKYTENFKETRPRANINAYAEEINKKDG